MAKSIAKSRRTERLQTKRQIQDDIHEQDDYAEEQLLQELLYSLADHHSFYAWRRECAEYKGALQSSIFRAPFTEEDKSALNKLKGCPYLN